MANTLKFGNGNWATKAGSTLAYNDESGFNPLPFDFTRASSATVVNKNGLIETVASGIPRIDFKDNTKGALLLEPQRTNSLLQSNQFDTTWLGSGTNVTSGYLGLDGTNSAWLLTKIANSFINIRQNINFSGIHTFSVYLKKGTNTSAVLRSTGGNDAKVEIDLINGTTSGEVNTTSVKTESMGNDWWRCSMTFNASSNTAVRIYPEAPLGGTTAGNIYIQSAQLEAGSYATSIINTSGSAVTRVQDVSKIVNSPILQATNQFTLFFDAPKFLEVNGGLGNFNDVMFTLGAGENPYDASTGIHIYNKVWYYYNGSSVVTLGNCYNATTDSRFAISYDGTKYTKYANGVKLGTNTVSASMSNWDTITNGSLSYSGDDRVFNLADLKLYNTALTDAELQALTTI